MEYKIHDKDKENCAQGTRKPCIYVLLLTFTVNWFSLICLGMIEDEQVHCIFTEFFHMCVSTISFFPLFLLSLPPHRLPSLLSASLLYSLFPSLFSPPFSPSSLPLLLSLPSLPPPSPLQATLSSAQRWTALFTTLLRQSANLDQLQVLECLLETWGIDSRCGFITLMMINQLNSYFMWSEDETKARP